MIFFSLGLPGCVAEWCDALTARTLGQRLSGIEVVSANSLQEVARQIIAQAASQIVVGSRQPDSQVRAALASGTARFVLALDDPRAAVADMVLIHGYDLPSAIRAVASSCAALTHYADLPGALVLRVDREHPDPAAAARAICAHFDLATEHAEITATALEPAGTTLPPRDIAAWQDSLDQLAQALLSGALDAYLNHALTGALGKFTWGSELFFSGDAPNAAAVHGIDITGRARCLLYGPFIIVPPGSWTAHVVLGCSKEAAGMSFMVEAFAGSQLSRTTVRPTGAGMFETSLGFVIEENAAAVDHPFQIRIFNERAAFDGRLGIGHVALIPQGRVRPDLRKDLVEVIGLAGS